MPYLGFSAKNDITINATSDLELTSDNTTIKFGADDDVTITHDPDDGLIFKSIATADDNPFLLTIQTGETDLAANDVIGKIQFQAPDEGTGTDANLVSAAIQAVAEGDFSSSSNATSLQFMTGSSEAAATKMTILSSGNVGIGTSAPLYAADIKTSGTNNGQLRVGGASTTATGLLFEQTNSGNTTANIQNSYFATSASASLSIKSGFTTFHTGTSGTERMRIDSSGNVGIGTTSPSAGLHIDNPNDSQITAILDTDNSAVKIVFRNNTETGNNVQIGADGSNLVALTNASEAMRIDSSGRVMIGTTDVGYSTHADLFTISRTANTSDHAGITIRSGTAGQSSIYFSDATGQVSGTYEASIWHDHANEVFSIYTQDYLRIFTGSNERMRIDSSGNVGIGTSSPTQALEVYTSSLPTIELNQADTYRGAIRLAGNDLELRNSSGVIDFFVGTNNDHESNTTRAMMITSAAVKVMNNTVQGNITSGNDSGASFDSAGTLHSSRATTSNSLHWYIYNSNGHVGSVSTNGSATSFNTSSDYRLKENVVTDWDATSRLKQLKPSRFNFKADKDTTVDGFLAHEVSSIVPEAITGTKDETIDLGTIKTKDGNIVEEDAPESKADKGEGQTWTKTKTENVYQSIDQSKLVPLLVKTIQELEARIAKLEGE